jgi:MFS family permease
VGGLLTDLVSWRWVFYLNIPFGLAAAVLLALTLTESFERRRRKVDYLGTALLTGGLVAVLLALLGEPGITATGVALFGGGVAMLALFVVVEGRAGDPIVPPGMFRDRILSVSAFGNLALGGVLLGVSVYVPLFVQGSLGGTALTAGAVVASLSIGWPVGSFVGGRMLLRTGYRATLLLGSALVASGAALCVPMDRGTSLAHVVVAVVVIGLGLGFSSTSYLVSVQNAVPWRRRGVATSSVVFFRTVGGSLGVAVMGALLNASLGDRYRAAVERVTDGDAGLARLLSDPNALLQPAVRARIPEDAYAELAGALSAALSPAFWVLLIFGVGSVAAAAFFPRGAAADLVTSEPEHG